MIENFKHKALKRLFDDGDETKGIWSDLLEKIENVLAVLNPAAGPNDMDLSGFRPHPSKGTKETGACL